MWQNQLKDGSFKVIANTKIIAAFNFAKTN
jgi:hypothetical protein